jgi:hypothetical protein
MERQIRTIILLLFLSVFAKAQIFTENFNIFYFDSTNGLAGWIQDDSLATYLSRDSISDLVGTYNLTVSGTFTNTSGSIMYSGGTHLVYGGTSDFMTNESDDFDLGLNDYTIQVWFKTAADVTTDQYMAGIQDDLGGFHGVIGSQIWNSNLRSYIASTASGIADTVSISGSTNYYSWARFDRSGNMIFRASLLPILT